MPWSTATLPKSDTKVHWRDVIALDISDPVLKKKVEGFLDYFEKTEFNGEQPGENGRPEPAYLSGQFYLTILKDRKAAYDKEGVSGIMSEKGFMKDGKFVIRSHNRPYDGEPINGSTTAWVSGVNEPLPIGIGTDYLKGARFIDSTGKKQPVTVDGVLAHELTHLVFKEQNEIFAARAENVIIHAMGGPLRINNYIADFKTSQNGGYVTLYDAPKPRADLDLRGNGEDIVTRVASADTNSQETAPANPLSRPVF